MMLQYGKPLLYEAVEKGHASCVQLLLDAGLTDDKMDYVRDWPYFSRLHTRYAP